MEEFNDLEEASNSHVLLNLNTKRDKESDKNHMRISVEQENKFLKTFEEDDFKRFKSFFERHFCKRISQDEIFNPKNSKLSVFEEILTSNESKAAKYVSYLLEKFDLWNNLDALGAEGKTLMFHVARSDNVEILFSFLMFDWYDHKKTTRNVNYGLSLKARRFHDETGQSLIEKLYELIDDEEKNVYQDVCLRLIYQLIFELDQEHQTSGNISDIEDFFCLERVFYIRQKYYRNEILKIFIVFWLKTGEHYEIHKQRISDTLENEKNYFFGLAFMLKERKNVKFEKHFELFLKHYNIIYGDYSPVILKPLVRLFFKIAEQQKMLKTSEFIYRKCPYIEINSTIMTKFHDVQDFTKFNIFPFDNESFYELQKKFSTNNFEDSDLTKLDTCIRDENVKMEELKRFIFGRNIANKENHFDTIFEQILSTPSTSKLIQFIWKKFELYNREDILSLKNSHGKYLINYVIDSKDDRNLMTFLMPSFPDEQKFTKNNLYLMMQNNQFKKITGKTLYEHHLGVCVNDVFRNENDQLRFEFFVAIFSLLEEISTFENSMKKFPMKELIKIANDEKFYEKIWNSTEVFEEDAMVKELKKRRYYVDDLIGNIVAYWSVSYQEYDAYKKLLLKISPFFRMLFDVLEGNEENFLSSFHDDLEALENSYRSRYNEEGNTGHYTTSFLFILFLTAMKNDRRKIIDRILDYETFITVKIKFPSNIKSNETTQYVAKKLLEHGHELGKNQIPSTWITPKMFEEFLNSRITHNGEGKVKMDCDFLLHPHTRKYKVKSQSDVDQKLIFWEDTNSLDFILKSESLSGFITHPVISTYVSLKTLKHEQLFWCNFWFFVLFFMLPFSLLYGAHYQSHLNNQLQSTIPVLCIFCTLSVIFLIVRQVFTYSFFLNSSSSYIFNLKSTLEILLILISCLVIVSFWTFENNSIQMIMALQASVTVLILLYILPVRSNPLVMLLLQKISLAIFKVFLGYIFLNLILQAMFDNTESKNYDFGKNESLPAENNQEPSSTEIPIESVNSDEDVDKWDDNEHKRASESINYYISYIYQLTSDFGKALVIVILVLFSIHKDLMNLTNESKIFSHTKAQLENFISISQNCFDFYENCRLDSFTTEELSWRDRILVMFLTRALSNYPFLHMIGTFYVNLSTKEITVEINRIQKRILTNDSKGSNRKTFFISNDNLNKIRKIVYNNS